MKEKFIVQIIQSNGKLFTTSIDVAEKFGKQHKNVLRAIANLDCSEDFNRLNFEPRDYQDERGKTQPMYNITKRGFQFLAMGFRGKRAAEWKEKYIDAFEMMQDVIARRANLSWQEQRQQGKIARRETTDAVQDFIVYAEAQGSNNARFYYKHITTATYKALFVISDKSGKSFRDMLDAMQLSFLQTAEYVAAKALQDGMDEGMPYKDIYKLAKDRVIAFAQTVPATKVVSGRNRIELRQDRRLAV